MFFVFFSSEKISEPAADLAVAVAIASSVRDQPVRADAVLIGDTPDPVATVVAVQVAAGERDIGIADAQDGLSPVREGDNGVLKCGIHWSVEHDRALAIKLSIKCAICHR